MSGKCRAIVSYDEVKINVRFVVVECGRTAAAVRRPAAAVRGRHVAHRDQRWTSLEVNRVRVMHVIPASQQTEQNLA